MEISLHLVLLIVAGVVILSIIVDAVCSKLRRKKSSEVAAFQENNSEQNELPAVKEIVAEKLAVSMVRNQQSKPVSKPAQNDLIMISLHAAIGESFKGYDFLQSLGAAGLNFGVHSIFHYHRVSDGGSECLFSAANLTKPGSFDVNHVDDINCKGLLLFLNVADVSNPSYALDAMLDVAYQLAEDLRANMFDGYNTLWTDETENNIINKVREIVYHGSIENTLEPSL